MILGQVLLLCSFVSLSWSCGNWTFPPGFKFGAANAAYQVEGAWNVSGRSESVWDRFTHAHPEKIVGGANGDVACDSYNLWKRDIEIAKELGLHFYRFSISWSRLLPTGFNNYINEDGKEYYNKLINGLLAEGIEPIVTVYHLDLPQSLQDLGGWTNPLIVDWFADYARIVFTLFADRVKIWLTINEPLAVCDVVYSSGVWAPGISSPDVGAYLCNKYTMLGHAKAYRIYDEMFRPKYGGRVAIVNQLVWYEADTEDDAELAELALENIAGRYSHPIYSKEGGWPPAIERIMAENSRRKGYVNSTFPAFTQHEIEFIRGTYDFYALNHYTSRIVSKAEESAELRAFPIGDVPDLNAYAKPRPEWPASASGWFYVYPPGIRRILVWLKQHYGDIEIMITENGLSTFTGLDDQDRIDYLESYLQQIWLAINEDGVNVTRYTQWSMFDNFEWSGGYRERFGLYEIDFNDPLRKRIPRASAHYYKNIIRSHSLGVRKPMVIVEKVEL